MSGFILGEKLEQSQRYTETGERIPTTRVNTTPCYLIDIKTADRDGYMSVIVGFGKKHTLKKTILGKMTKAGIQTPLRFFKEFRIDSFKDAAQTIEEEGKKGISIGEAKLFIGDEIKPSLFFKAGDRIKVTGISKGKGFQGVVKRHGFAGGPRTHGQSDRERAPGSIGQTTTPGRVYKGKRMAGHMGSDQITVRNLPVIEVVEDGLVIKGLVPGATHGLLQIESI
jgi:large subunit ribosomal protein L3